MLEHVHFAISLFLAQLLLLNLPYTSSTGNTVQKSPQYGLLIVTITKSSENKYTIDMNRIGFRLSADEIAFRNKLLNKMLAPKCKLSSNGGTGLVVKCVDDVHRLTNQLIKLAKTFILSANSLLCLFKPPIVYADMIVLVQTADLSSNEVDALVNGVLKLKIDVDKIHLQMKLQSLNRFMAIELVPKGKGGLPPCANATHKTTTRKHKTTTQNATTITPKAGCKQFGAGACKSNDDCCQTPVKLFCYEGHYCTCVGDGAPCIYPSFTGDNVQRCCTGYCDSKTNTCGAPKGGCQPKGYPCTDDYKVPCCDDLTCIVNSTGTICAECHSEGGPCLLNNSSPGCCAGMICVTKKLSSEIGVCKKV